MKPAACYFCTDESENALDYLERAWQFIQETEHDVTAWKWVVIALNGALYGFAICALEQGNVQNVVKGGLKKPAYVPSSKDRLISFGCALRRCQNSQFIAPLRVLALSPDQKKSIRKLRRLLRNQFEHFMPRGWLIEIHGMPQLTIDVLEAIRWLALRTGASDKLGCGDRSRVEQIIADATTCLRASELHRESRSEP